MKKVTEKGRDEYRRKREEYVRKKAAVTGNGDWKHAERAKFKLWTLLRRVALSGGGEQAASLAETAVCDQKADGAVQVLVRIWCKSFFVPL